MIKAKITSKTGASLEQELPTDIHELHHALTEMSIRKTPRSILLTDDNAAEVKLTLDSKSGNGLLRVFGRNDTLADANTVAFAVSTAREEILPELEQNILHNQYLTKEMLFNDIREMTQAAGPVKLTFYCPLVGQLDDGECDEYIDVGSGFLAAYQDQIEQGIADEQGPEITNLRESGKTCICLDAESEYEELTRALGGCYIDFMSGEYTINPLETKAWTDGSGEVDAATPDAFKRVTRLSQHIAFLKDFFRAYKDFTDAQIDTIEILLMKLYARFGILGSPSPMRSTASG